jgi:hypothetical protein
MLTETLDRLAIFKVRNLGHSSQRPCLNMALNPVALNYVAKAPLDNKKAVLLISILISNFQQNAKNLFNNQGRVS